MLELTVDLFSKRGSALTIMAILVPMSLLATFRLTGILESPLPLQTITKEAVFWSAERPSAFVSWYPRDISNSYDNDDISIKYVIYGEYMEGNFGWEGLDCLGLLVKVNASVTKGIVESATVNFSDLDAYATLDILLDYPLDRSDSTKMVNLKIADLDHSHFGGDSYIRTESVGQPKDVYLQQTTFWAFADPDGEDHRITATLELVYHTSTARFKIVLPVTFHLWADAGNSFESAKSIPPGEYIAFLGYANPPEESDLDDYYKIVQDANSVNITMISPDNASFDLYLYDLSGHELDHAFGPELGQSGLSGLPQRVIYSGNIVNGFYVRVAPHFFGTSAGAYTLSIITG